LRGAQSGAKWIGGAFIGALLFFYDMPQALGVFAIHVSVAGATLVGIAVVGALLDSKEH
jgi:hypothetical protein